jgi:hypothetical protein
MTDPHDPTGHPRVDAALAELDRIADLPPEQQVAGFATVQQELQATLSTIDSADPAPHPAAMNPAATNSAAMHAIANARQGR